MSITIQFIDHVVLRVSDMSRALAFYCDVLGCEEERRLDDLGLVQLRAGQCLIDLVDIAKPLGQEGGSAAADQGRNMDHFCVRVEPFDEGAIRAHLQQHGIAAGPTAPRYGSEGTGPSIYINDPEGNVVELKGPGGKPK